MGRTKVAKANPPKQAKGAKLTAAKKDETFHKRLLAVYEPLYTKWEERRKASKKEQKQLKDIRRFKGEAAYDLIVKAQEAKQELENRRKNDRARAETISVMGTDKSPYTRGSDLAVAAVKVIEDFLLKSRHFKSGDSHTSICFGQFVHGNSYGAVLETLPIPDWPVWPEGASKRVVRWFSKQCMIQIVHKFVATHPEFSVEDEDEDSGDYPMVTFHSNNCAMFCWAYPD